jgi:hypothetical protein
VLRDLPVGDAKDVAEREPQFFASRRDTEIHALMQLAANISALTAIASIGTARSDIPLRRLAKHATAASFGHVPAGGGGTVAVGD